MNEDIKRPVLLALTDDTIDHIIRALDMRPNANDFYSTDGMKNVIKQLKAEQKRLFYTEESSTRPTP